MTDERIPYRVGDIVPILATGSAIPAGQVQITQIRTQSLGPLSPDEASKEGFYGVPELFEEWWKANIGPWDPDQMVAVLDFKPTIENPSVDRPLKFQKRFIDPILEGVKTQTRRDWFRRNDENKADGYQQGPGDTHPEPTNGEQT